MNNENIENRINNFKLELTRIIDNHNRLEKNLNKTMVRFDYVNDRLDELDSKVDNLSSTLNKFIEEVAEQRGINKQKDKFLSNDTSDNILKDKNLKIIIILLIFIIMFLLGINVEEFTSLI